MSSERGQLSGGHDSGAVAVETALVSLLLLTIIFGIVETSLLFKDWLVVSTAARAGARMGSSEPRAMNFAQDSADQVTNSIRGLTPANIQEVWVYKATYATGLPDSGSFASCTVCVKYTWNGTKLQQSSNSWDPNSQNACAGDPARDAVGVYVKYKHAGMGFFFTNAIVAESTVMWLEPTPNAVCKP